MALARAQAIELAEFVAASRVQRFMRSHWLRVRTRRIVASQRGVEKLYNEHAPLAVATLDAPGVAAEKKAPEASHKSPSRGRKPGSAGIPVARRRVILRRHLQAWWHCAVQSKRNEAACTIQRLCGLVRFRVEMRSLRTVLVAWKRWTRWHKVRSGFTRQNVGGFVTYPRALFGKARRKREEAEARAKCLALKRKQQQEREQKWAGRVITRMIKDHIHRRDMRMWRLQEWRKRRGAMHISRAAYNWRIRVKIERDRHEREACAVRARELARQQEEEAKQVCSGCKGADSVHLATRDLLASGLQHALPPQLLHYRQVWKRVMWQLQKRVWELRLVTRNASAVRIQSLFRGFKQRRTFQQTVVVPNSTTKEVGQAVLWGCDAVWFTNSCPQVPIWIQQAASGVMQSFYWQHCASSTLRRRAFHRRVALHHDWSQHRAPDDTIVRVHPTLRHDRHRERNASAGVIQRTVRRWLASRYVHTLRRHRKRQLRLQQELAQQTAWRYEAERQEHLRRSALMRERARLQEEALAQERKRLKELQALQTQVRSATQGSETLSRHSESAQPTGGTSVEPRSPTSTAAAQAIERVAVSLERRAQAKAVLEAQRSIVGAVTILSRWGRMVSARTYHRARRQLSLRQLKQQEWERGVASNGRSKGRSDGGATLNTGDRVMCRWWGGYLDFPGCVHAVQRSNMNGRAVYSVLYDDGAVEHDIPRDWITVVQGAHTDVATPDSTVQKHGRRASTSHDIDADAVWGIVDIRVVVGSSPNAAMARVQASRQDIGQEAFVPVEVPVDVPSELDEDDHSEEPPVVIWFVHLLTPWLACVDG